MAAIGVYDVGDLVRIVGSLTTQVGANVDPTSLTASVLSPSGVTTVYTLGQSAYPIRSSQGVYYIDVTPTEPGEYWYQFKSTGTGQAVDEGRFAVKVPAIPPPVVP